MPKVSKVKTPASKAKNILATPESAPVVCSCCGRMYNKQRTNFPSSQSPLFAKNGGYLPVCGDCVDGLLVKYRNDLGDDLEAARRVCMKFDIYWDEQLFKTVCRSGTTGSLIRSYIGKTNLYKYTGKTFDDTLREEALVAAARERSAASEEREDTVPAATEDDIDFWGEGYSDAEYRRLNRRYKHWTSELPDEEIANPGTQTVYKQICTLEIIITRNISQGKPAENATKQLIDLMNAANVTPAQKKKSEDVETPFDSLPFGVGIKIFENERPIPQPLAELEDVDGVRKYITVWFFGHLCHMLHIKNSYCKMYEQEMAALRVERPELADEDDEEFLNDIFGGDMK